ncbi:hypothetical protein [Tepidiphilus olei]|uniref:hypothetical protein n=1 Tax=Tepidiphilus olei TaxID=2502184 RepID=UPI00115CF8DC|nr:hypothetical protein [Tepidiphilus olei]
MIQPTDFLGALFETLDKSAIDDFRAFLAANAGVTKWQIAADYCLHDQSRPNNAFAFSVIPYDDYLDVLKGEIRDALPKDLKKTKSIGEDAAAFLVHPRRFHFGFVFRSPPAVFNNGPGSDPRKIARESLAITVEELTKHGRSKENMRRLKALKQHAQASSFNVGLLADMYVLSYLLCFVTLVLARERPVEIVGWFSDRDKMTTWCDGVIWDFGRENLYGLAEHFNIPIPQDMPVIAVPTPDAEKDAMWFDEFIRLPDYIAGIIAAWNFATNELPGDKSKYLQLAEDVVADARNMAVLNVQWGDFVQCSRMVFSRESPKPNGPSSGPVPTH